MKQFKMTRTIKKLQNGRDILSSRSPNGHENFDCRNKPISIRQQTTNMVVRKTTVRMMNDLLNVINTSGKAVRSYIVLFVKQEKTQ
jgi:hypothetical protein